ncbi:MAG TPA: hypothetical protein VJU15_10810 [Gemmatimonadales bacterium]|nr:hypothetical protein [Gemmatimonadales bacterium]
MKNGVGITVARGARPLTEQQLRTLEAQLASELERLMPRSADGTSLMPAVTGSHHPEAMEVAIRNFPAGYRRKAMHLLAALGRIGSGNYGICAGCFTPIAFERLEVIPETAWCRRCSPTGPREGRPVA